MILAELAFSLLCDLNYITLKVLYTNMNMRNEWKLPLSILLPVNMCIDSLKHTTRYILEFHSTLSVDRLFCKWLSLSKFQYLISFVFYFVIFFNSSPLDYVRHNKILVSNCFIQVVNLITTISNLWYRPVRLYLESTLHYTFTN